MYRMAETQVNQSTEDIEGFNRRLWVGLVLVPVRLTQPRFISVRRSVVRNIMLERRSRSRDCGES
jgi:hypothetical protein